MRFDKKVALITAAASGIGRATADIISAEGGTVVAVDTDKARLDKMLAEIQRAGGRALTERLRPRWDGWSKEQKDEELARNPLRRVAEARDQARVIGFLASSDADFVTGVTIDVTGGV